MTRRLFVTEEGPADGPVVLLVHGFASSHHAWDRVAAELTGLRVIRVDLLGHGRTGGPAADTAAQAAAVLDELSRDLADVTVVGHSYGADVAVALAADPRISRVVVVTQGPDYTDAHVPRLRVLTDRPVLVRRLHRALRPVLAGVASVLGRSPHPLPGLVAGVCRDVRATDPGMVRIVLADRRVSLDHEPLDARLSVLRTPAMVVLGGRDRLYGDRSATRYRTAGARVEIIAAATHALSQQHPAALAALLRDFAG